MERAIVVSHFHEDLSWLANVPKNWDIYVYNRADENTHACEPMAMVWDNGVHLTGLACLKNIGREPYTFLKHIVNNYDVLDDLTVFVQGNPFDHYPELLRTLDSITPTENNFTWMGIGGHESYNNGAPHDCGKPVGVVSADLGLDIKAWPIHFAPGGQFAVTRDRIHAHPKEFYEKAIRILEEMPESPWCFERLWGVIFGA